MTSESCTTCRFFRDTTSDPVPRESSGECRRYPKERKRDRTYWCGEYRHLHTAMPSNSEVSFDNKGHYTYKAVPPPNRVTRDLVQRLRDLIYKLENVTAVVHSYQQTTRPFEPHRPQEIALLVNGPYDSVNYSIVVPPKC